MTMAHEQNPILAYQAWLATVKATKRTALHAGRKLSNLPAVLKAYLYPKQLILPHKLLVFANPKGNTSKIIISSLIWRSYG